MAFLVIILIIVFLCPYIVNFIISKRNPLNLGFIDSYNRDSWINFIGAIIGGSMTLIGVRWTIIDQNAKRREELSLQYKPILLIDKSVNDELETVYSNLQIIITVSPFNDFEPPYIKLYLYIKNTGRGEAQNINFTSTLNDDLIISEYNDKDTISILPAEYIKRITLYITNPDKYIEDYFLEFILDITYTDLQNLFKYKNSTQIKLHIKQQLIHNIENHIICVQNNENHS